MQPTLRCRPLRGADSGLVAAWLQKDFPAFAVNGSPVAGTINRLLQQERIKGAVFEKYEDHSWQALSIGISGFVRPEIIDAHLARPEPFLFHTLLSTAAKEPRQLMDPDDQAPVNSTPGAGLDLLAHWMQRSWDMDDPLWRQVYMMAHENYIHEHRGYRINRMFHEDWARDVDIYLALGHRTHSQFTVSRNDGQLTGGSSVRNLYYMDRREILTQAPGSAASYLLQYAGPVCGFTRSEQRLLRRALEGLTDQQLAGELDLSVNTLKTMWRSIYDRVETHAPFVLSDLNSGDSDTPGRGSEKRRSVLSFIEAHPQELRPYRKA